MSGVSDRGQPQGPDEPDGHGSLWAASIYQHASAGADRAVAEALDALLTIAESERASKQTGSDVARTRASGTYVAREVTEAATRRTAG
jgi:hypothetical protein